MTIGSHDAMGNSVPAAQVTSAPARRVVVTGNRIDSPELFAGERELLISHGEDTYRLRLTFQNKLILTK
jgi:hemin uptake protein HemP